MSADNGATRTNTQFSVFLANKPNMLAQVCQALASRKINIIALSMMDTTEHGVLRLVVADPEQARSTLAALNVPTTETKVLMATLPNRPGALADVVERLASHHIAVSYAYCTAGTPGGKVLGVFRVSDLRKAERVLAERRPRRRPVVAALRNPVRARRK